MAIPVAYFGYSKSGLTVSFINTSLNLPTTYSWDFGDGNTSTLKSPSHTYSGMGFFTVTLIATNADGDSEPLSMNIGVGMTDTQLDSTLPELIDQWIPSALRAEMTAQEKISLIQKWQLYLQPLVEVPHVVAEVDTHNEFAWPGLANALIAQLVAYDLILQGANQFLSASGNAGGNTTSTGGEQVQTQGTLKSIETGPAKTEWYEGKNSTSDSEIIKNIGEAFSSAVKAGGALDQLKESICQLAQRIRVFLPMCGQLAHNTQVPKVGKSCKNGKHNANPFGITDRMI